LKTTHKLKHRNPPLHQMNRWNILLPLRLQFTAFFGFILDNTATGHTKDVTVVLPQSSGMTSDLYM